MRGVAVDLWHEPLDDDTCVDDEDAHRASRSSRIMAVLSDWEDCRKRFSHRADNRRVSARSRVVAFRKTSWISAWSDLP
jgi:hypothetical protein